MKSFKNIIMEDLEPSDFESRKISNKKEYEDATALHHKLVDHYSNYTQEHKNEIKNYTNNSKELNGYHWNKFKKTPTPYEKEPLRIDRMNRETKVMDSVLNAHKTPHDLTVWSNSRHDPRELKNSEGIVHHPAYISGSILRDVSKHIFWNAKKDKEKKEEHIHIMKIHVPKDHPGAYVDHLSELSSQKEFILPRGLNLKYKNYQTQKFGNTHYHYHHMEIQK